MTFNPKLFAWLTGNDTGLSSMAIARWMETRPAEPIKPYQYPYLRDSDDLGRCIRLLGIAPEYRDRLLEMSVISPEWAQLVTHWDELEALYRQEVPPGHKGFAPKCNDRMNELLYGYKLPVMPEDENENEDEEQ